MLENQQIASIVEEIVETLVPESATVQRAKFRHNILISWFPGVKLLVFDVKLAGIANIHGVCCDYRLRAVLSLTEALFLAFAAG